MRRWLLPALMITLLLSGCGNAARERGLEELRRTLNAAEKAAVTAEVTANLGSERFSCTLACTLTAEETVVELLAPETVAGIRAVVGRDGTQIKYEGLSLGIGGWTSDASPVTALPHLLTALRSGSVLRSWTEREGERALCVRDYYLTDDTTLTVWFDPGAFVPVHAEFIRGGETVLRCEILDFTYE